MLSNPFPCVPLFLGLGTADALAALLLPLRAPPPLRRRPPPSPESSSGSSQQTPTPPSRTAGWAASPCLSCGVGHQQERTVALEAARTGGYGPCWVGDAAEFRECARICSLTSPCGLRLTSRRPQSVWLYINLGPDPSGSIGPWSRTWFSALQLRHSHPPIRLEQEEGK
ncbi:hypothetical protein DPEC_G00348890 [Dallia pectoralis]|uniref:Uncharacterized protein n=1 Tax=Dallia pectoralis TaxID=75939 RepID=A0ACC2F1I6_DALPE|nr:hypothetical protein DPEC_G00348890 [Dallia pectoralis]